MMFKVILDEISSDVINVNENMGIFKKKNRYV